MPNSNQARICVLGFRANRMCLVSRFCCIYIFYITTKRDRSQYQLYSPMQTDAVRCPMQLLVWTFFIAKTANRLRSHDALQSLGQSLQTLSLQRVRGISAWKFINTTTLERMQP